MGGRSLSCMSSVKDSLFNRFEGSLLGKLCDAMLVYGLSKLGRKVLMSFGISDSARVPGFPWPFSSFPFHALRAKWPPVFRKSQTTAVVTSGAQQTWRNL
jgi:hypothetical protein